MADTYQAIYDAVRSKIQGCYAGDIVESVARDAFSGIAELHIYARDNMVYVAEKMTLPHVLMRPALYMDGDKWCALYGDNIQDGVAGFGNSPADAMDNFDANWHKSINNSAEGV